MSDELQITPENFGEYFFDVRNHQPQRGQVMARYAAAAELIDGGLKRDLIDMLCLHEAPETVAKLMRKIGCATERDSVAVPLVMAKDLLSGSSPEDVAQKPYRFVCEAFFYTQKDHIPIDDPHWSCIGLNNLNEFLDAKEQRLRMKSSILTEEEVKMLVTDGEHLRLSEAARIADAENPQEDSQKAEDIPTYRHYDSAWSDSGEAGADDPQTNTRPILDSTVPA